MRASLVWFGFSCLTSYQQLRSFKDGLPVHAMRVLVMYACVYGRLRYVCVSPLAVVRNLCRLYSATTLKHTAEGQQHTPPGHIILTTGEPVVPLPQCRASSREWQLPFFETSVCLGQGTEPKAFLTGANAQLLAKSEAVSRETLGRIK